MSSHNSSDIFAKFPSSLRNRAQKKLPMYKVSPTISAIADSMEQSILKQKAQSQQAPIEASKRKAEDNVPEAPLAKKYKPTTTSILKQDGDDMMLPGLNTRAITGLNSEKDRGNQVKKLNEDIQAANHAEKLCAAKNTILEDRNRKKYDTIKTKNAKIKELTEELADVNSDYAALKGRFARLKERYRKPQEPNASSNSHNILTPQQIKDLQDKAALLEIKERQLIELDRQADLEFRHLEVARMKITELYENIEQNKTYIKQLEEEKNICRNNEDTLRKAHEQTKTQLMELQNKYEALKVSAEQQQAELRTQINDVLSTLMANMSANMTTKN